MPTAAPIVWPLRLLIILACHLIRKNQDQIQIAIDHTYDRLKINSLFRSVYFETVYTILMFWLLMCVPRFWDKYLPILDAYKIDQGKRFVSHSPKFYLREVGVYLTPLGLLDTFMVKWYAGVPASEISENSKSMIQIWRALPDQAPRFVTVIQHLILAHLIFDACFFVIHVILHKNAWGVQTIKAISKVLYKNVHSFHHKHADGLHPWITNQLTVIERVALVLSANFALKIQGAHPFTRFVFVPIFLWLLIENHCNYDFPWSYDKLLPWGFMGGSRHHHEHHTKCNANYQPYFTYLDWIYAKFSRVNSKRE